MWSCAHVHMASACVYICMNVCRAAAVLVLCNLEQPVCSGSIPHKQSQAALYVYDAIYASAPKTGQGTASNSCQSTCQYMSMINSKRGRERQSNVLFTDLHCHSFSFVSA